MDYKGFILHHSRCPSINGKGFDFWVGLNGSVYAAPLLTDPEHIHICLEGNYGEAEQLPGLPERQQQLCGGEAYTGAVRALSNVAAYGGAA
ncbi:hypothetical protein [Paenibacillus rhizoplanae]|uniref:hypothetical protein n=1 Tax=Paenibacillus rhizoplanae TaxID=1917181 RepID=UPI00361208CF